MVNLTQLELQIADVMHELKRKKAESEKDRKREEGRILARHSREIGEFKAKELTAEEAIESEMYKKYAGVILHSMDEDNRLMAARSGYVGITEEHLRKAGEILSIAKHINDDKKEDTIREMVRLISEGQLAQSDRIMSAIKVIEKGKFSEWKVHSYISQGVANGVETFYMATPIPLKEKSTLASNLETRIMELLDTGEVTLSFQGNISRAGTVESIKTERKDFSYDEKAAQGFAVYELKLDERNPSIVPSFLSGLAKKMEESNQPEGFEQAKLISKVIRVEPQVIRSLFECQRAELYSPKEKLLELLKENKDYIALKEASRITGRTEAGLKQWSYTADGIKNEQGEYSVKALLNFVGKKRRTRAAIAPTNTAHSQKTFSSRLNYSSTNSEDIKKEAEQRLNELKEKNEIGERGLSVKQITYVLGIKPVTISNRLINLREKYQDWKDGISREGNRMYVAEPLVKKFIEKATPSSRGWTSYSQ